MFGSWLLSSQQLDISLWPANPWQRPRQVSLAVTLSHGSAVMISLAEASTQQTTLSFCSGELQPTSCTLTLRHMLFLLCTQISHDWSVSVLCLPFPICYLWAWCSLWLFPSQAVCSQVSLTQTQHKILTAMCSDVHVNSFCACNLICVLAVCQNI